GLIDPASAEPILRTAGTSENYRGLFQSARNARPIDGQTLDKLIAEFPEKTKVPPLAEAMVAVEHTHDHLKQIASAGWQAPPNHPDLEPAHEALLLREHFTELLRLDSVQRQPAAFRQYLKESEIAAGELEAQLREKAALPRIVKPFEKISKACTDCHQQFRD